MAVPIQNLRSGTATKRPVASGLAFGQVAVNFNEADPAVYLRGDANALIKVSPVFVGTGAPNATPASGGSAGNSKGEQWLDTASSPPAPKIFDGSAFVNSYTFASGTTLIQPVVTSGTISGTTIIGPTFSGTTFEGTAGTSFFTSAWTLGANGSDDYTFTGPGFIGAENDPTLYLVRGQRYKFTNAMGAHPFRIQSTPNGSTGTAYNDGVTNNDVSNGSLTWNVQFDTPGVLYYQCTSHAGMGGKIYIIDAANIDITTLDINGGTDIGAALVDADLFVVDDGGAGTNRKAAASRITDYTFNKVSGDVTIASNGVATVSNAATATTATTATSATSADALNTGNIYQVSGIGINTAAGSGTAIDVAGRYAQTVVAVGALDIDCSAGNYFTKTIAGDSTFTFSNVPASRAFSFILELTHTSGAVTWPASVKFPGDTAPTLTTGKTHLFIFVTDDGGTRFRGASLVDYVN